MFTDGLAVKRESFEGDRSVAKNLTEGDDRLGRESTGRKLNGIRVKTKFTFALNHGTCFLGFPPFTVLTN